MDFAAGCPTNLLGFISRIIAQFGRLDEPIRVHRGSDEEVAR
jgi:hypothetical protein